MAILKKEIRYLILMYLEEIHERWFKSKENLIQVNIQKKSALLRRKEWNWKRNKKSKSYSLKQKNPSRDMRVKTI